MTYHNLLQQDTICALATQAGGAIGVIRVSGEKAIEYTQAIFSSKHNIEKMEGYTIAFGNILNVDQEIVDEVLVSVFHAPHSYTGENSTEISCHGSSYILQQILQSLIKVGCRQAEPGEFTQRAYLNGKMDLSQAEAVADLIASSNKATHRIAMGQLRGNVSNELSNLRDKLLHITSLLELELDFSDHEDLEFADRTELLNLSLTIEQHIAKLTHTFEKGQAIKKGIPVAIVGNTNVGKSTLLNKLLHEEKAIVSDIQGTTRDSIEDVIDINGIAFRFIDTAGIRQTTDVVEKIGIDRTWQKIKEAAIVLWVIDNSPTLEEYTLIARQLDDRQLIVVINKMDMYEDREDQVRLLKEKFSSWLTTSTVNEPSIVSISAKNEWNIDVLVQEIYQKAHIPELQENDVIITNSRHYAALTEAHNSIVRVIDGLQAQLPSDLVSEDLKMCLFHLAEITGGQITPDEVIHNIFKHFCIGK